MVKVLLLEGSEGGVIRDFLEITKEQFKLLELLEKDGWLGENVECVLVALEDDSSVFHRI